MRRLALCLLIFPPLIFATTKERDWKAGKVSGDSSISSGEYTSGIAGRRLTWSDPDILVIQGSDYTYTAEEKHAWDNWCLLIQGEEIHYSQDNHRLYVTDPEGYKCRLDILKQEKRPSP